MRSIEDSMIISKYENVCKEPFAVIVKTLGYMSLIVAETFSILFRPRFIASSTDVPFSSFKLFLTVFKSKFDLFILSPHNYIYIIIADF